MASQRDVKNKIASVKNIQKITRAMEMVAAARLRRAEQRISALRPYADAIGRMTRQAAQAAGAETQRLPLLREHESESNVGLLLVTGDRGLAGGFNSQVIRAGVRLSAELTGEGLSSSWYATGRRGVSSLSFRGNELSGSYTGFSDRPSYADARTIAEDVIQAYVEGHVDRVEMLYNSYVSPLTQQVTRQRLLPVSHEAIAGERDGEEQASARGGVSPGGVSPGAHDASATPKRTSVDYEPDPEKILRRLVPDYIEISIYRALVESAAGFFGRNHHGVHTANEPRPPSRDHARDHGGGGRRGGS
jgi:F-type H+-transporting ATPase subunit gamma